MNLVALEVEDYRQFAGIHRFTPGQQSMAAIIGPNGSGKTTLFESIEWCLYNPSYIRNEDIRPRVVGGKPRVKVILEHPLTGELWEIERELGLRTISASIYRSQQPETPVVQGTRQVTEYIESTLLGLPHQAFVATFFTRQKELSFFGSMTSTERRREVGKLLGLETIRLAQKSIGEQRLQKQQESAHLRRLHDDQASGRDFVAERQSATDKVRASLDDVARHTQQLSVVTADLEAVKSITLAEEERSNRHNGLRLQESRIQGERIRTEAAINADRSKLNDIELAIRQIDELRPQANQIELLTTSVNEHEHNLRRFQHVGELKRRLEALDLTADSIRASVESAAATLASTESRRVEERLIDLSGEIDRLIGVASAQQAAQLQETLARLERSQLVANALEEQQRKVERYEREVAVINGAIAALSVDNPQQQLETAVRDRAIAVEKAAAARAAVTAATGQRDTLEALRKRLESGHFDKPCPTCGRPYSPDELDRDLAALRTEVASLTAAIESAETASNVAARELKKAEVREQEIQAQLKKLDDQQARLRASETPVVDARSQVEQTRLELNELLTSLGRESAPSQIDIDESRAALAAARTREQQLPLLQQLRLDVEANHTERDTVSTEISSVGNVSYDPAAHQNAISDLRRANEAAAKIEVLERTAASRSTVEQSILDARLMAEDLDQQLQQTRAEIDVLGFQPETLAVARANQQSLQTSYEHELRALAATQQTLSSAQHALAVVDQDEQRVQSLLASSIESQRIADELDRMYKEFARFEQFVVRTVTPAIAEITSQLVASVTDGKYDRIEFTEDFGIQIFDGADDAFPLSQFSGGERDVIALCARLALSQFIGGQSAAPPQFVVLDEVFGSLDRQRRENLMETLQKLISESGVFRQLFVISHVDDVQTSASFDEVWRVRESADGFSQLEQLSGSSLPEDI